MDCGLLNAEPDLSIHLNNIAPRKTLLLNARDVKTNLIDTLFHCYTKHK